MLVQKLEQYRNETSQRKRLDEIHLKVELLKYKLKERKAKMPMGKGTYGTTKGRPPAKKKMTAKQKTLPSALQKKIMASKKKK